MVVTIVVDGIKYRLREVELLKNNIRVVEIKVSGEYIGIFHCNVSISKALAVFGQEGLISHIISDYPNLKDVFVA